MSASVELDRLTRRFGPFVAVDGISLKVEQGEVLGFLGPNGAGKSTTMRMVAGFLAPSSGTARVCGHDVRTDAVGVKRVLGYMAEGSPSYEDMTVAAFLNFIGEVRGLDATTRRRRIEEVVDRIDLGAVYARPIEVLSKGFKRRVGLAQAILHDPPVLILDEPTDGLDPNQKHQVRTLIQDMAAEKVIIVSTHILEEVEAVCSRAVIIGRGKLLADGTAEALLNRLPEHNAICVVVPAEAADKVIAPLEGLEGIAGIDQEPVPDGCLRLRCRTANGALELEAVSFVLNAQGITPRELYRQRGSLDDVFRRITDPVQGGEAAHG